MTWVPIPKANHAHFEAAVPLDDRIELKRMFGGIAMMLNGRMAAGLFGTTAMVRLGPGDLERLAGLGGAPFDPRGSGRPMAEILLLPPAEFSDPERLVVWLAKAAAHVSSLPARAAGGAREGGGGARRRTRR